MATLFISLNATLFYRSSQLGALSSLTTAATSSKFVLERIGSAKARARKERLNGEHVLKRRVAVSMNQSKL